MMKSVLVSLLAVASTACAHYTFPELVVAGQKTGLWSYVRKTANYQSNGTIQTVSKLFTRINTCQVQRPMSPPMLSDATSLHQVPRRRHTLSMPVTPLASLPCRPSPIQDRFSSTLPRYLPVRLQRPLTDLETCGSRSTRKALPSPADR